MKLDTKRELRKIWKELKKMWAATMRFLWPYRNLDKLMLKPKIEPFVKKYINQIYLVGLIIIVVAAILGLASLRITSMLGTWLTLFVIFVIFRFACEMIVDTNKTKSKEEAPKEEKTKGKSAKK